MAVKKNTKTATGLAAGVLGVLGQRGWSAAFWSLVLLVAAIEAQAPAAYWPQWRGPLGNGVAPNADPPVEWGEDKNIRWKVALPGSGHSTPIVWGKRVFVTAAVPFGESVEPVYNQAPGAHDNRPVSQQHQFVVLALSRASGQVLWQRTLRVAFPHEGGHFTASLASPSPVTDGEHLVVFFGSQGLYGLNLEGDVLWEKDLGQMQTRHAHGEGASPVLAGGLVAVNWDHEGDSFIAAFDKASGQERWRAARDEMTSWSTPLVVEHQGRSQVVVSATGRVRSYDLASGALVWECGGLSRNVVASPVAAAGMVYVANSYDWQALMAIRLDGARGDITGTEQVAWTLRRLTPYVPSPLLYGQALYVLQHNQGILSRLDAKSGKALGGPYRLRGLREIFASPVGAADRLYITDRMGATLVLSRDKEPRFLALNRLDDSFSASAAVVDRELYLRGEKFLYCLVQE